MSLYSRFGPNSMHLNRVFHMYLIKEKECWWDLSSFGMSNTVNAGGRESECIETDYLPTDTKI